MQDALKGFTYVINAPRQTFQGTDYQFVRWSDGGAVSHTIVTPATGASFVATYAVGGTIRISRLAGGGVRLHFTGTPGVTWRIQAAPDLKTWQTIGTQTVLANGTFDFNDTTVGLRQRFYRCLTP